MGGTVILLYYYTVSVIIKVVSVFEMNSNSDMLIKVIGNFTKVLN